MEKMCKHSFNHNRHIGKFIATTWFLESYYSRRLVTSMLWIATFESLPKTWWAVTITSITYFLRDASVYCDLTTADPSSRHKLLSRLYVLSWRCFSRPNQLYFSAQMFLSRFLQNAVPYPKYCVFMVHLCSAFKAKATSMEELPTRFPAVLRSRLLHFTVALCYICIASPSLACML